MAHLCCIYQLAEVPFLLEAGERLGHQFTMLMRPPEPLPPQSPSIRRIISHDIFADEEQGLRLLQEAHDADRFDGLVCIREIALPFAAKAAARLGLPFPAEDTIARCRDKRAMRDSFARSGANHPRYIGMEIGGAIPADVDTFRLPLIVKPAAGVGSAGVRRVDARNALPDAIAEVRGVIAGQAYMTSPIGGRSPGLVIEEYVDGPEYVCETFSVAGRDHVLAIGYKGYPTGPYFEETVYRIPSGLPPEVEDEIAVHAARAVLGLGILDGPAHTELRVRFGREPMMIETGARIGGSGVSHVMVREATGLDFMGLLLDGALGQPAPSLPDRAMPVRVAAMYIVPVGTGGTVDHVTNFDRIAAESCVIRAMQFVTPGRVFRSLPHFDGYPAVVFSRHRTKTESEAFHARLERELRVVYRDPPRHG